jgi:hypothetical protein
VDCEYLSGGTFSLLCPHHSCQVTPGPYLNVTMFQSVSWVWGPFLCSLTVPQQERKGSCLCTVYSQIFYSPCQISHCSLGLIDLLWFMIGFEILTVLMHLGLNWCALYAPYQFMGALLLC